MKNITKKVFTTVCALLFILISIIPSSAANGAMTKEEVIYANLNYDGSVNNVYSLNIINSNGNTAFEDFGEYSRIVNLSDTEKLIYADGKVTSQSKTERFYYQGYMENKEIPWIINIDYKLDGKTLTADKLSGANGSLEINIDISENKNCKNGEVFYKNYTLQIQVTFDMKKAKNITAQGAAFANSGSNKIVTCTSLSGQNGNYSIKADINNYSMSGIQIAAIPMNISFNTDSLDFSSFTKPLTELHDGISKLSDGTSEINKGIKSLNEGISQLSGGSVEFKDGLYELSEGGKSIKDASKQILDALLQIDSSLSAANTSVLDKLPELMSGLVQLSEGLDKISAGLGSLSDNYNNAYSALDQTLSAIPNKTELEKSAGAFSALAESKDPAVSALYKAFLQQQQLIITIKTVYEKVSPAFTALKDNLPEIKSQIDIIKQSIDSMTSSVNQEFLKNDISSSITQLSGGISQIFKNYKLFDTNLNNFTNGLTQTAQGYTKIDGGLSEIEKNTDVLEKGMDEISSGLKELNSNTEGMDEKITTEANEMINKMLFEDYNLVSFVSEKNNNLIKEVQFVLKTPSIDLPEIIKETPIEVKTTLWDKIKKLFNIK